MTPMSNSCPPHAQLKLARGSRSRALTRASRRETGTHRCPLSRSSGPLPAAAGESAAAAAVDVAAPTSHHAGDATIGHLDLGARRSTARVNAPTAAADEYEATRGARARRGICLAAAETAQSARKVRSHADPTCQPLNDFRSKMPICSRRADRALARSRAPPGARPVSTDAR